MPAVARSTGLTITNPLIQYRALLATKRIEPDPAQHRLAIHLQKLYFRLKDYKPEVDYRHRIDQLNQVFSKDVPEKHELQYRDVNSERPVGIFGTFRKQAERKEALALTRRLTDHEAALQIDSPQGLLLYGEVGTGKSLLVDILADSLPNQKKKRLHFNTFMLEVLAKLEILRKGRLSNRDIVEDQGRQTEEHSLLWLARDMIANSPILFLDEFQLPDRAASKILSNLLTSFFHLGGVLVATSNRMPEELANASGAEFRHPPMPRLSIFPNAWGLSRSTGLDGRSESMFSGKSDFAAFLDVLRTRCEVWDMEGGKDWRRREAEEERSPDNSLEEPATFREKGFAGLESMAPGNIGLGYEQSIHLQEDTPASAATRKTSPSHYLVNPSLGKEVATERQRNDQWNLLERKAISSKNDRPYPYSDLNIPWQSMVLHV